MTDKVQKIREEVERLKSNLIYGACSSQIAMETMCKEEAYNEVLAILDTMQEESVSEELEEAITTKFNELVGVHGEFDKVYIEGVAKAVAIECGFAGAKWQKQQDQSTIELAEDHAYFAGRTKTIDEIKEALLSEVLPCFMHGGEADEVVAKLDEVLKQK